jgi:hypothetical protein
MIYTNIYIYLYIRYNDIHMQFVWIYIVNIFTIISRFFKKYIYTLHDVTKFRLFKMKDPTRRTAISIGYVGKETMVF